MIKLLNRLLSEEEKMILNKINKKNNKKNWFKRLSKAVWLDNIFKIKE